MKHSKDYEIVVSEEGIPLFALPFCESEPQNPILLYDGGKHATLFRNENDVVLIDYLPSDIPPILQKCNWMVVIERNVENNSISLMQMTFFKAMENKIKIIVGSNSADPTC